MARKGGKRGGSSAARSAAAKKGWETRRRGGAKPKPAARKATAPTKPKQAAGRRGMPKTTSARGRALTNQRRAADLVRASRGGKGPSAKAVRSVLTAQRARAFYAATGGGKKRSAVKPKSAAKVGKSIRAQGRAKATAARAKVAGRARAKPVSGAKQALTAARARFKSDMASARGEADRARARVAFKTVVKRAKREDPSSVMAPRRGKKPQAIRQAQQRLPKSALRNPKGNAKGAIATRLASRERIVGFVRKQNTTYGGGHNKRQYERALKSQGTIDRAKNYLSTGKLPGRDNSIRAQREMRQAQARLAATNAARQAGKLPQPMTSSQARKQSLQSGAKKNTERASKLEAKAAALEKQYRSKDSAYWTQPVKPAGRDQMREKIGQAVQLRDQAAALRTKAANAERQAAKINAKPIPSGNGNARLQRAINNQVAAGPRVKRSNAKQWNKRATALRAQKVYKTNDPLANLSLAQMARPGFRVTRDKRRR